MAGSSADGENTARRDAYEIKASSIGGNKQTLANDKLRGKYLAEGVAIERDVREGRQIAQLVWQVGKAVVSKGEHFQVDQGGDERAGQVGETVVVQVELCERWAEAGVQRHHRAFALCGKNIVPLAVAGTPCIWCCGTCCCACACARGSAEALDPVEAGEEADEPARAREHRQRR